MEGLTNVTSELHRFISLQNSKNALVKEALADMILGDLIGLRLGEIERHVSRLHTGISQLAMGKMSPLLFPADDIAQCIERLNRQAAAVGYTLARTNPLAIYSSPVYYQYNPVSQILSVYIAVPLVRAKEEYELWKFIPTPVQLPGRKRILEIATPTPYIAIDTLAGSAGGSDKPHAYSLLTEKDFSECQKVDDLFVCTHVNVIYHDPEAHCTSSLYYMLPKAVANRCMLTVRPAKDDVYPVGPHAWYVHVTRNTLLTTSCKSTATIQRQTLTGSRIIYGAHGCTLSSSFFTIRDPPAYSYNYNSKPFQVQMNVTHFAESLHMNDMEDLITVDELDPISLAELKRRKEELSRLPKKLQEVSRWSALILIPIVLCSVCCIGCLCKWRVVIKRKLYAAAMTIYGVDHVPDQAHGEVQRGPDVPPIWRRAVKRGRELGVDYLMPRRFKQQPYQACPDQDFPTPPPRPPPPKFNRSPSERTSRSLPHHLDHQHPRPESVDHDSGYLKSFNDEAPTHTLKRYPCGTLERGTSHDDMLPWPMPLPCGTLPIHQENHEIDHWRTTLRAMDLSDPLREEAARYLRGALARRDTIKRNERRQREEEERLAAHDAKMESRRVEREQDKGKRQRTRSRSPPIPRETAAMLRAPTPPPPLIHSTDPMYFEHKGFMSHTEK